MGGVWYWWTYICGLRRPIALTMTPGVLNRTEGALYNYSWVRAAPHHHPGPIGSSGRCQHPKTTQEQPGTGVFASVLVAGATLLDPELLQECPTTTKIVHIPIAIALHRTNRANRAICTGAGASTGTGTMHSQLPGLSSRAGCLGSAFVLSTGLRRLLVFTRDDTTLPYRLTREYPPV